MPSVMVPMRQDHADDVIQIIPVRGPRGGGSGASCWAARTAAAKEARELRRRGAE